MLQVYSFLQHHSSSRAAFPGRMEKPLQAGQPWCTHGTRVMEHFPLALQSAGICARPVLWPGHSWKAKLRGSSSGAAQRGLKIQAVLREFPFHCVAACPIPGHWAHTARSWHDPTEPGISPPTGSELGKSQPGASLPHHCSAALRNRFPPSTDRPRRFF